MKTLLSFVLFVFTLSSCGTTYYYAQMKSNDPYVEKDSIGNFIVDSDSLRITYSFHGENAPVNISVKNKMKQNLYIDWEQSYFIFGDNDENRLNISEYMEPWEVNELIISNKESVKSLFELSNLKLDQIPNELYKDTTILKINEKKAKVKFITYNEETTPLYIRSRIVLYIGNTQEEPLTFDQDFHIASVAKANKLKPAKLNAFAKENGDIFYIKIERGKGFLDGLEGAAWIFGTVMEGAAIFLPDQSAD